MPPRGWVVVGTAVAFFVAVVTYVIAFVWR